MTKWVTEFSAICAKTGELKIYGGPNVPGLTMTHAQDWCHKNAGHLKVIGQLISEIPCKKGKDGYPYEPDWENEIIYSNDN